MRLAQLLLGLVVALAVGCLESAPELSDVDASTADASSVDDVDSGGTIDMASPDVGDSDAGEDAGLEPGLSIDAPQIVEVGLPFVAKVYLTDDSGTVEISIADLASSDFSSGLEQTEDGRLVASTTGPLVWAVTYEGLDATAEVISRFEIRDISVGEDVACVVTVQGRVWCWGTNDNGQLGRGLTGELDPIMAPVDHAEIAAPVEDVECGESSCIALTIDGDLYGWGVGWTLRLNSRVGRRTSPRNLNIGFRVLDFSYEHSHGCAVVEGGRVGCWGKNDTQQTTGTDTASPFRLVGNVTDEFERVEVSNTGSCASRAGSGAIACWGDKDWVTGTAAPDHITRPENLGITSPTHEFSLGRYHGCAITAEGATCWGDSSKGGLGDPNDGLVTSRTVSDGNGARSYVGVHAVNNLTFLELQTGPWWVVGTSCGGNQATGSTSMPRLPEAVAFAEPIEIFEPGTCVTCAVAADGVYCAGESEKGLLGPGVVSETSELTRLPYPWEL